MLNGYTNAYMVMDSKKSTSSYVMTFVGEAVSWQSRLQKCVVPSFVEAECIVVIEASKELLWIEKFLQKLRLS